MTDYGIKERKQTWVDALNLNNKNNFKDTFTIGLGYESNPLFTDFGGINFFQSLHPENQKMRIEKIWKDYENSCQRISWLKDDYIPFLNCISGTEIFAEAFGCKVHRPDDNMPFALPLIYKASEVSKIKIPRVEDTPLMRNFEVADQLKERAGKDALLRTPDLQCPMDIVFQIWDKTELFIAMIEEPEAVKELIAKVKTLFFDFVDMWFYRYGTESIAHHPFWYIDKGISITVDEVGCINSDMFEEFFLPEINEIAERYSAIGFHCCANSDHQWENFSKIENLKLINLYRPPVNINKALDFFGSSILNMHFYDHEETYIDYKKRRLPLDIIKKYLGKARMSLVFDADSKDEALEICETAWELLGRD